MWQNYLSGHYGNNIGSVIVVIVYYTLLGRYKNQNNEVMMDKRSALFSMISIVILFSCSKSSYLNITNGYDNTIQNVTWGDNSFGNIDAQGQKKLEVEAGSNSIRFTKSDTLYETSDKIDVDARSGATINLNLNTRISPVVVSK